MVLKQSFALQILTDSPCAFAANCFWAFPGFIGPRLRLRKSLSTFQFCGLYLKKNVEIHNHSFRFITFLRISSKLMTESLSHSNFATAQLICKLARSELAWRQSQWPSMMTTTFNLKFRTNFQVLSLFHEVYLHPEGFTFQCFPEWLASDALELPSAAIDIEPHESDAVSSSQRRTTNRSINLPDRISESGYLQSSAGEDVFSDMLEGGDCPILRMHGLVHIDFCNICDG
jgi:hypothetical protein